MWETNDRPTTYVDYYAVHWGYVVAVGCMLTMLSLVYQMGELLGFGLALFIAWLGWRGERDCGKG